MYFVSNEYFYGYASSKNNYMLSASCDTRNNGTGALRICKYTRVPCIIIIYFMIFVLYFGNNPLFLYS